MAASIGNRYPVFTVLILSLGLLVSGCVSAVKTAPESKTDHQAEAFFSAIAAQPLQENIDAQKNRDVPVVRYGRYRLVEITPQAAQSDLMTQIVDVTIPLTQGIAEVTVGEAMRYVLQRSGYRLCDTPQDFDNLPLPVAHSRLGPVMLRDALTILAGPAWTLQIDDATRQVCFVSAMQNDKHRAEKTGETK